MTYVPTNLRQLVLERAEGCCEYCRLPESAVTASFHVEHIIAVSHGGQTDEKNLALSCPLCNHHKGPNIAAADPDTGDPTFLFHPRLHIWDDHFWLKEARRKRRKAEQQSMSYTLTISLVLNNAPY